MLLSKLHWVSLRNDVPTCAGLWAIDVVVPVLEKCVENRCPCEQAVWSPPSLPLWTLPDLQTWLHRVARAHSGLWGPATSCSLNLAMASGSLAALLRFAFHVVGADAASEEGAPVTGTTSAPPAIVTPAVRSRWFEAGMVCLPHSLGMCVWPGSCLAHRFSLL